MEFHAISTLETAFDLEIVVAKLTEILSRAEHLRELHPLTFDPCQLIIKKT